MEGNSQLDLLRGSFSGDCPWHLADWVEGIHPFSADLSLSNQNVIRESNYVVDTLAKAGTSRTDLACDA